MNILLTGATGFIGSHLCESLRSAGHRLTALCRNPEAAKRRIPALVRVITIIDGALVTVVDGSELQANGCCEL